MSFRMLLLTGAEVDLEARTWSLPRERCKNGHAHVVPLSDQAIAIIFPRSGNGGGDLVFGVSGFCRAKKALAAVAKLSTPWCLHDLRRTCASGMARLGVAPHFPSVHCRAFLESYATAPDWDTL